MWFLIKAAFWLGLVFLILPDRPDAPNPLARLDTPAPVAAVREVQTACRGHADLCQRAGTIAATVSDGAIRAALARAHDTLRPDDRAIPFGGHVMTPDAPASRLAPAAAPASAPLPQRRPA